MTAETDNNNIRTNITLTRPMHVQIKRLAADHLMPSSVLIRALLGYAINHIDHTPELQAAIEDAAAEERERRRITGGIRKD
jgi:hypothetical protein